MKRECLSCGQKEMVYADRDVPYSYKGLAIFDNIPLRYIKPDFVNVLKISKETDIYAYDAYVLECAIKQKAPILTLDKKLKAAARELNVETMEV